MDTMFVTILTIAVRAGTPLMLATQGGIITERSGVINIGIEGMMLMGALFGFMFAAMTRSPWLGVLAACIASTLLSLLHALLVVGFGVNQIVSGLVLNFLGIGLSSVIGAQYVGQLARGFRRFSLGPLADIPYVGPALFNQDALVYLSYIIAALMTVLIFRTRWGMSIRSIGDNPVAADSAGLPVRAIRTACVALGGALCGLAGAYLSLAFTTMWQPEMTAGRGWIAIAMIIFAQWHPLKAVYSAYLFGGITALQFAMQVRGVAISPHFLQMLPYLFTIVVLSFAMLRARGKSASMEVSVGPASLGRPYARERG